MTRAPAATRPLLAGEVDGMTALLADAFMVDPLYQCLAPAPEARRRWLRWVMGMFLRLSHRLGGALCLDATPDAGVICLVPPGRSPPSFAEYLRAAPGVPPLGAGLARVVRRGARAATLLEEVHPTSRHLYVLALGVAPGEQGKGIGTTLLRSALVLAAASDVPCYLETASPANVGLYERLGFVVQRALAPPDLPPLWTMLRRGPPRLAPARRAG